jgi:glycosyltransferase involved in cell wall biosynthesis
MKFCVVSHGGSHAFQEVNSRISPPWRAISWRVFTLEKLGRFRGKAAWVIEEIVNFVRLILAPSLYGIDTMMLADSHYASVLAFGKWLALLGLPKRIYIINIFLHESQGNRRLQTMLKFLLGQDVGIMAFSVSDREYFKNLNTRVNARNVPWCFEEEIGIVQSDIQNGEYIFAGGYSNRDYDLLIRCARKFPNQRFEIAASKRNSVIGELPPNVHLSIDISQKEFHVLLAGCKVNVIPLKSDVGSSGQMVAIAAMRLAKATVYPDFAMIGQYFQNEKDGLMYRPGDVDSLASALRRLLDNPDLRAEMGRQARRSWETKFNGDVFKRAIFEHMADFMGVTWKEIEGPCSGAARDPSFPKERNI